MNSKKKPVLTIAGVGMMGGSLGLALKKRRSPYRIVGLGRNPAKLKAALKAGCCDAVTTDPEEGVREAEIVVICTAVGAILPTLGQVLPHLKRGAVVTDIGSVKGNILAEARNFLEMRSGAAENPRFHFIGGHPLAGSEKTGVESSNADLYADATVVLCPLDGSRRALNALVRLWRQAGARTLVMEPEVHDILVAQTSHLPHLLAAGFVKLIGGLQDRDPNTERLLAGSFRDFTRIADSDPNQWAEIAAANQDFLLGAAKSYGDILQRTIERMEKAEDSLSEWRQFFEMARGHRRRLLSRTGKT